MVLPTVNVPEIPAAGSPSPISSRSIVPVPADALIAISPTAVLPPIMPAISTAPEPELMVKVSVPAFVAFTVEVKLIAPLPESVSMVVLPPRTTAPVRVTPPGSVPAKSAVSIVPFKVIVVPVIAISFISVPRSSIVTLPATAFKVTSVETPPAVPRIGTLIIILPPVELIVRSAASERSILPSAPPSAKVTTPEAVVKVMSAPVRL